MSFLIAFLKGQKIKYLRDQSIRPYTSMRIGGEVNTIAILESETKLKDLLKQLAGNQVKYVLLGSGTNIIFPDQYSDYLVIINKTSAIKKVKEGMLRVNTGLLNKKLLAWCVQNQAGGLEFLAGLPGTIGGAAAVNAGAFGKSMEEVVVGAEIFNRKGEVLEVEKNYFQYAYRDSVFKSGSEVILNLFLTFTSRDRGQIRDKIRKNQQYRLEHHPPSGLHSAGCFFKNPFIDSRKVSAGKKIQEAELKGFSRDHLSVSEKHANFIINSGQSSFEELRKFAENISNQVWKKHQIRLVREVTYISPEGDKY